MLIRTISRIPLLTKTTSVTLHTRFLSSSTSRLTPKIMLTLYAKGGCSLCDKAKAVLQNVRKNDSVKGKIQFQYVDITDPINNEWWDSYCFDVPVLHLDKKHEEKPVKFMHYLDAEKIITEINK